MLIQEKMKQEKNLKKDDNNKKKKDIDKINKKLKDRDLNEELKNIKFMVDYLLDFLEKSTNKK